MKNGLNKLYYVTWFQCKSSVLADEFIIITAHNPEGRTISTQANEELNLMLFKHLNSLGLDYFEVAAGSKNRLHIEASYAIACDLDLGLQLCNHYAQDAIFWIKNGQLNIVSKDGKTNDFIDVWSHRLVS
ncbi:DUF3293 domain-containing protein [Verrucomicrobiaceae bacterium R5-34]|nr:DUF3293 domain-containing protein [Verrucomicrobiaceae bacterium R5-34]